MPETTSSPPALLDGVLRINGCLDYSFHQAQALLTKLQRYMPGVFCYKNSYGTPGDRSGWSAAYEFHWTAPPRTTQKAMVQALVAAFDHDPDFDFIKAGFHARKTGVWRCSRTGRGQQAFLSLLNYEAYDAAVAALYGRNTSISPALT